MLRRMLLVAPVVLGGCAVLNQPYVEPRRYPLLPRRPGQRAGRAGRKTLLVRSTGAAPGLESRLLPTLQPNGTMSVEYYAEWTAPPAGAAEEALRTWLIDSGLFSAVLAPGTRGPVDLLLESQLVALHIDLARGVAVASMSAVVMRETGQFGTQVVGQISETATVPVPPDRPLGPDAQAAGMVAALGAVLAKIEARIARHA
ncbi:ABC-type transport auxiliary lipoprotein family protein [Roseomonas xinghualingensis]|uniref:ABC-type transport auxiliary lipoprotein family protein n=1 Tax=Roseomonas xinghualingensis TaxID=2986475 RepID=UPI0021F0BFDE|nr:ABC-type transport auxiliary lipoprotein family protein [Roseomonas sp. SXEYE001]MCV4207922.1 ABC-type transport auxiliary lipoprotein family protein [Roseomonas sp. SXEYE001]